MVGWLPCTLGWLWFRNGRRHSGDRRCMSGRLWAVAGGGDRTSWLNLTVWAFCLLIGKTRRNWSSLRRVVIMRTPMLIYRAAERVRNPPHPDQRPARYTAEILCNVGLADKGSRISLKSYDFDSGGTLFQGTLKVTGAWSLVEGVPRSTNISMLREKKVAAFGKYLGIIMVRLHFIHSLSCQLAGRGNKYHPPC